MNDGEDVIEKTSLKNGIQPKSEFLEAPRALLGGPWKKTLQPLDEGPHFHRLLPVREWWYFNVVFDKPDSGLRNWSVMVSFNYMSKSFDDPDILFVTLYDDRGRTYGGMSTRQRGVLQATGPGVDVKFENSWVKGVYPQWNLHIEDGDADLEHEIILDFSFEAECSPYWVIMNTGHGCSLSPMGYYSINHCDVTGSLMLDGECYEIHGSGYHDHTWALYMIGGASFFWDWFSVHFDNGLHAFIWQIIPLGKEEARSISPGFCWITDGRNFTDIRFFTMNHLEFENTSIPGFKRPKLFHVVSVFLGGEIDLYLETKTMHEYLWGDIPVIDIALWEGSCVVTGTIRIDDEVFDIEGLGVSEILRII